MYCYSERHVSTINLLEFKLKDNGDRKRLYLIHRINGAGMCPKAVMNRSKCDAASLRM